MKHSQSLHSIQDALGNLVIGDGYLLRADGVAVALLELTPPDLRLYDTESLAQLLEAYTTVLYTCPDRCSLLTMAMPLDIQPLIHTLSESQQRAPDFRSYSVLGAMADWLDLTWAALLHFRTVRWFVAVPSVRPEIPPSGTWGELLPAAIVGQINRIEGDAVSEALGRAERLRRQFASLGVEPAPRLLSAETIRHLVRAALDPIASEGQQRRSFDAPRLFQIAAPERQL